MRPAGFPAKFGCYRSSNVTDPSVSNGSNAFLVTAPAPLGARRRALAVAIALFIVFCALIPFAREMDMLAGVGRREYYRHAVKRSNRPGSPPVGPRLGWLDMVRESAL